jgi:hypothetical protein
MRQDGDINELEVVIDDFPLGKSPARRGRATLRARHNTNDGTLAVMIMQSGPGIAVSRRIEFDLDAASTSAFKALLNSGL